jgi:sulfatase maturation enzyme AslB (radical SAM superfamily)
LLKVIFYGAGSYLARNFQRLSNGGYDPVCVCDSDKSKWNKPFSGRNIEVLPPDEAFERFPQTPILVTVDIAARGEVLHSLTNGPCVIPTARIINWSPVEHRLGCLYLESTIKFRTKKIFARCYWRHPGIDRTGNTPEDIRMFGRWRDGVVEAIRKGEASPCDGCEHLKMGWYLADCDTTGLQLSESDEYSFCNFNCCYCFTKARNKDMDSEKLPDID